MRITLLRTNVLLIAVALMGIGFWQQTHAVTGQSFSVSAQPASVPADGYTEFTVTSAALTVPNNTLFTVTSATGAEVTGGALAPSVTYTTPDVDNDRTGLQIQSTQDKVTFTARAGAHAGPIRFSLRSDVVDGIEYVGTVTVTLAEHKPFTIDRLTLSPEAPTTNESTKLVLEGHTATPSWDVSFPPAQLVIEGTRPVVVVHVVSSRIVSPSDPVDQAIRTYRQEMTLPTLTEDTTYLIRIFGNGTVIKEHVFNVYDTDADTVFGDVDTTYWAYDYIMTLWRDRIVSGYEDRTFRPENSITRAELLKIILKSGSVTVAPGLDNPFTDVPADAWYVDYVLTANNLGIATGVTLGDGDRNFAPNKPITRAESLKMLFRAFEIPTVRVREVSFDDLESWQTEYVETAVAYDLAHGYGGRVFGPNRSITRAEASKIIERTRRLDSDAALLNGSGVAITETGKASYYADSLAGRNTASGVPYDPIQLTAAHRSLPFGTRVLVTNTANDQSVEVEINDRGPWVEGRILDLSRSAFETIATLSAGVIDVVYSVIE